MTLDEAMEGKTGRFDEIPIGARFRYSHGGGVVWTKHDRHLARVGLEWEYPRPSAAVEVLR